MLDLNAPQGRATATKIVSLTMGFLALGYTGTILLFTFLNDPFYTVLGQIWQTLGVAAEPTPNHTFYKALALGNMFMLVAMSYWLWRDPVGKRLLLPVVFVSKLSSSTMGALFFLLQNGYASNLVIPFTDLSQVFMAWFFYKWMNEVAAMEESRS